jgi:hypothetical protein
LIVTEPSCTDSAPPSPLLLDTKVDPVIVSGPTEAMAPPARLA